MEVKELNQYSGLCPMLFEIITLLEFPYLKKTDPAGAWE